MAYTPVAGKFGRVEIEGNSLPLSDWRLDLTGDVVDVTGFGQLADADGNVMDQFLVGLLRGELVIKGRYDSGVLAPMLEPVSLRPNVRCTVFVGFTSDHGIQLQARVVSVSPSTQVADAGNFEARLKIELIDNASHAYAASTVQTLITGVGA